MKTVDEIPLADRDRTVIHQAAEILRRQFPVRQILLYGSKARGDDDAESDIDLLVLMDHPMDLSERGEVIGALYPLQREHGVMLSPLILSEEEWINGVYQVLPIREEIDQEGVIV